MTADAYAQWIGLSTGGALLTGILIVWRRSLPSTIVLVALQGAAVAALVTTLGLRTGDAELLALAPVVLLLRGVVLPLALRRALSHSVGLREETQVISTAAALLAVSLLAMLSYLVSRPLGALGDGPEITAVPVGILLVMIGLVLLTTRSHAVSQATGFLVLDNGIACVAFLTAGGVPLVVELGVSLDVLLVVVILQMLTGHIRTQFGATDLDDLTELRD